MLKRQTALALIVMLLLTGHRVAARQEDPLPSIILEARLLAFSPHRLHKCGGDMAYQVAKYRVLKVLAGNYTGKEIVVDHLACDGDVFKRIPVGSRVQLRVHIWREGIAVTMHPGIRMSRPEVLYKAMAPPQRIRGRV